MRKRLESVADAPGGRTAAALSSQTAGMVIGRDRIQRAYYTGGSGFVDFRPSRRADCAGAGKAGTK